MLAVGARALLLAMGDMLRHHRSLDHRQPLNHVAQSECSIGVVANGLAQNVDHLAVAGRQRRQEEVERHASLVGPPSIAECLADPVGADRLAIFGDGVALRVAKLASPLLLGQATGGVDHLRAVEERFDEADRDLVDAVGDEPHDFGAVDGEPSVAIIDAQPVHRLNGARFMLFGLGAQSVHVPSPRPRL